MLSVSLDSTPQRCTRGCPPGIFYTDLPVPRPYTSFSSAGKPCKLYRHDKRQKYDDNSRVHSPRSTRLLYFHTLLRLAPVLIILLVLVELGLLPTTVRGRRRTFSGTSSRRRRHILCRWCSSVVGTYGRRARRVGRVSRYC